MLRRAYGTLAKVFPTSTGDLESEEMLEKEVDAKVDAIFKEAKLGNLDCPEGADVGESFPSEDNLLFLNNMEQLRIAMDKVYRPQPVRIPTFIVCFAVAYLLIRLTNPATWFGSKS